jgi:zinc transport system ATP-binding protein
MSARPGDTLLSCQGLVVGYGGRPLLPAIDLELRRGELLLVVGRNGAGKSTWLKTLLGLLPAVSGRVVLATPAPRRAYIPQAADLDELLPVRGRDLVDWGRLRGWSFLLPFARRADRAARRRALDDAGAAGFDRRPFRDLSGGQRQRILFARILAADAELALLDEPTASMDVGAERDAYERLAALAHDRGLGVVIVTHTLSVAARHADRVLFLDAGERDQGVAAVGTPAEIGDHPLFRRYFGALPDHAAAV